MNQLSRKKLNIRNLVDKNQLSKAKSEQQFTGGIEKVVSKIQSHRSRRRTIKDGVKNMKE